MAGSAGGGARLGRRDPLRAAHHVGLALQREGQRAAAGGLFLPHRCARVLGREHRHAGGAQCADHRAVLAGDGLDRVHELLVLALGVVDQRHRGLRHRGQRRDLARVVHAELDDRGAMPYRLVLPQAQQRQRHADLVVEVALGGQHRRVAQPGAQDRRDHLRHRGLAVAAGDGNDGQVLLLAPGLRQQPQRRLRVGHQQPVQARLGQSALGQGRGGAAGLGLGQEVVGIEALAAQRDEQVARAQRAGVGVHAQQRRRRVADQRGRRQQRRQQLEGAAQRHEGHRRHARRGGGGGRGGVAHSPALSINAARAACTSENARRSPWISW